MDKYFNSIIERAEKDVQRGDLEKAISRYEGSFRCCASYQLTHNKVGELYQLVGDEVRAGKHFYLKEKPTSAEEKSIALFEKAYGYSATLLLRQLMYRENYRLIELSAFAQDKLINLIELSTKECGVTPKFMLGRRNQLAKIKARR